MIEKLLHDIVGYDILAIFVSIRLVFKPISSFFAVYIAPYIDVKPTKRLLKHPLYKIISYIFDWILSIKLPKE